jgi:hypothetical protein
LFETANASRIPSISPSKAPIMPPADSGAQHASVVSRVLTRGYKTLRFPEPLETKFRADHLATSRRWVRMSLLVAAAASMGSVIIRSVGRARGVLDTHARTLSLRS